MAHPSAAATVPLARPHRPAPVAPPGGGARPPAGRSRAAGLVGSLALTVLGGAAVVLLYVVAVLDPTGRSADQSLMRAAMSAGSGLRTELLSLLGLVSVPTVALAVAVLAGAAMLRGRGDLAASVVAVVLGSQLVTQAVKAGLPRPGSGEENSLPSGHVTLIASLVVALVVVLPPLLRPLAAVLGAGVVAAAGLATMVTGWHRPSDVLAAVAVVAAVGGLVAAGRLVLHGGGLTPVLGRPRPA